MLAANQTDNLLEKSGILLDATTNLTQCGQQERSRRQLSQIRELLTSVNRMSFSQDEKDEFLRVTVGVEIEEAEVLATESKIEAAIEQLTATLARFKNEIKESTQIEIYDEIQTRRAYFLVDLDRFEEAIPVLEEVKSRRNDDTIFLFYLGHSYFRAKRWSEAQEKLERSLSLSPRPRIAFQAHGSLGMVFCETDDYQRAKQELETCAKIAAPDYIKQAHIWERLEYTCIRLGLKEEARQYGQLARPS
jgi:tetratricopeptide (TPR) repeat protein